MWTMNYVSHLLDAVALLSQVQSGNVKRNIPYVEPAHERQVLDVYAPPDAKNLPVVFWIHGGGWQTGDKMSVQMLRIPDCSAESAPPSNVLNPFGSVGKAL